MSEPEELFQQALAITAERAREAQREEICDGFLVGPCGGEGDGFELTLRGWEIGWFATRADACELANSLKKVLRQKGEWGRRR